MPLVDPAYVPRPANYREVATNLAESSANGIGVYLNDTISIGSAVSLADAPGFAAPLRPSFGTWE